MNETNAPILVTGGSGFIAGHIIALLLEQGRRVRTTARSASREDAIRAGLARIGAPDPGERLEVVAADLDADDGWEAALSGIRDVMHVASPVMPGHVADEDDVIRPAREGTLRVLRAARDAGARRVVLTSAFHAVGFGWGRTDRTFTEADWSRLDGPGIDAYGRAKTLAERAAWEFVRSEGDGMELVAMLPVAVLGPVTSSRVSGGNALVRRILTGEMARFPDMWLPIVDVRDVAAAHVLALSAPDAAGERFIVAGQGGMTLSEIAATLRSRLGPDAGRVGSGRVPTPAVRLAAFFNPKLREAAAELGRVKKIDGSKAREVLGWSARPTEQTVLDTARSLLQIDSEAAPRG
jgi:nucleoside-diphosphate-sugar epimerase